jgi:diguanylate cyclase (GGDEF)-like protein/PAS domain S-box-containing protein
MRMNLGIKTADLDRAIQIVEELPLAVYVLDRNMKITYWNSGSEKIAGFTPPEVLGKCCSEDILRHTTDEGVCLCDDGCPAEQCLKDGEIREANVFLHHRKGHRLPVSVKIVPAFGDGPAPECVIHMFGHRSAIVQASDELARLRYDATTDELTDLPNRRFVSQSLESWCNEFRRTGRAFGLMVIDVDTFKSINDGHGHPVGDQVLIMIAKTLKDVFRNYDIVGRWGGDEFVAVVVADDGKTLDLVAERARAMISETFLNVGENRIKPTISIGAALVQEGETAEMLFARADGMLLKSKNQGRNCVNVT